MELIKELWEENGWRYTETEFSYMVTKEDGLFIKNIRFNIEDKRFYNYLEIKGQPSSLEKARPFWIDESTLKLIRKTARILKWKI